MLSIQFKTFISALLHLSNSFAIFFFTDKTTPSAVSSHNTTISSRCPTNTYHPHAISSLFSLSPFTEAEVSKPLPHNHPTSCILDPFPSNLLSYLSRTPSHTSSTPFFRMALFQQHSSRLG